MLPGLGLASHHALVLPCQRHGLLVKVAGSHLRDGKNGAWLYCYKTSGCLLAPAIAGDNGHAHL